MNYKDYKVLKEGCFQSVGMIGDIYVYEILTGVAFAPVYYQIMKDEFDTFEKWQDNTEFVIGDIHNRKSICSAYKGLTDIKDEDILSEEELKIAHDNETIWRSYIFVSSPIYDGTGTVTIDYKSYELTKNAYDNINYDSFDDFLSEIFLKAYHEISTHEVPMGTYCKTIKCPNCGYQWYFNETKIPDGEKYEIQCAKCKSVISREKVTHI